MKTKNAEARSKNAEACRCGAVGLLPSAFCLQPSRRGIALVITLILLSVTLIMAVAFLAVARRERNAVTTTTDTATARLAADTALAVVQAQIAANLLATNAGAYNYGLLISTNYINSAGFSTADVPGDVENVNYDYYTTGGSLSNADLMQNIANLYLLPRAPVFVPTNGGYDFRFYLDLNRNGQFDANNGATNYDSAGNVIKNAAGNPVLTSQPGDPEWIGVLEHPDQPHGPNNPFVARYAFFAQPVGNGLDLNYIHNQTLAFGPNVSLATADEYYRNEGVGSWELNLAAFLADLNTNQWNSPTIENAAINPYTYLRPAFANTGAAFEDARSLLSWRYANSLATLAVPPNYFYNALVFGGLDGYTVGSLMTTTFLPAVNTPPKGNSSPWVGSDNTNRYFSLPSDAFDTTKNLGNFPAHLSAAGTGLSTYDRYTFYRMLAQLGTDSTADSGKLNLNYSNAVVSYNTSGMVTNIAIIPGAETNAVPWVATNFFNAAADRLLRAYTTNWFAANPTNYLATYYGAVFTNAIAANGLGLTNFPYFGMTNQVPAFGLTNIPVYVNGVFVYSPAVNRLLQLAANIYDASTNQTALLGMNYPTVFRPIFNVSQNGIYRNVFIQSYQQVILDGATPYLATPTNVENLAVGSGIQQNVYGVPWIIGAKKGFPALNQLSMIDSAQFERLLEVQRNTVAGPVVSTNQLVVMAVTNNLGISFWNSYSNDYVANGQLSITVNSSVQMALTNSDWGAPYLYSFTTNFYIPFPANNRWPGSRWTANGGGMPQASSFIVTNWNNNLVPPSIYNFQSKKFTNDLQGSWDATLSPLPQFGLTATNLVQAYILDGNHVIDYVQLRGPIDGTNLNDVLQDPNNGNPPTGGAPNYYLWVTSAYNNSWPSWGIMDQLTVSSQPVALPPTGAGAWNNPPQSIPGLDPKTAARDFFFAAFTPSHSFNYGGKPYYNNQLVSQAPFTPVRTIFGSYLYQVNDPLVHYLASDLDAGAAAVWQGANTIANGTWNQNNGVIAHTPPVVPVNTIVNGQSRYQPWGATVPTALNSSTYNFSNPYNLSYKDPLVWGSDYWDFPTNRYPTVGWLGRVHRGTPWQTVYLKSGDVLHATGTSADINTWSAWTGDHELTYGQYLFDAAASAPVQDRLLFDLFTTSLNDNATRGTLSVNQSASSYDPVANPTAGLAAWAAVFSGMVALSNDVPNVSAFMPTAYTNLIINPAGVSGTNSALGQIVASINATRTNISLFPLGAFTHVGDILSVPALTEQSPFLHWADAGVVNAAQQKYGISDELYEWLPQQVLGLLRVASAPRYVVYCYGQTLRPAPNGLVTSSAFFGLCTNYQITAESAARAVIRVDQHVTVTGTNYTTVIESYNPLPPN